MNELKVEADLVFQEQTKLVFDVRPKFGYRYGH